MDEIYLYNNLLFNFLDDFYFLGLGFVSIYYYEFCCS